MGEIYGISSSSKEIFLNFFQTTLTIDLELKNELPDFNWSEIHGFRDSVPNSKIHGCY